MARETTPYRQPTFNAGELSPRMLGRTDIAQYRQGLAEMENWLPVPTGPVTRRPGTKYIGTKKAVTFPQATERASATGAFDLNAVCFTQDLGLNGRWVAVGDSDGTEPVIVYCDADVNGSPTTWVRASSVPNENENALGVAYANGLFVLVGTTDGTDAMCMTSPDGITWTSRVSGTVNVDLNSIIFTGTRFVSVGNNNAARYSADGITWSTGTGLSGNFNALYFNQGTILCAKLGAVGTSYSLDDGATWNTGATTIVLGHTAVIYWNGYWYIASVTISRKSDPTSGVFTEIHNNSNNINAFFVFGGYLVGAGSNGEFAYTSDGTTWTETTIEAIALNGIATSSTYAVIVGDYDTVTDAQLFTLPLDTSNCRTQPFIGSTGPGYIMELGHQYIRFIREEAVTESAPGTPYSITSPWDANDVDTLQFAQAQDVMYITHKNYAPRRLTRTSETAFTLENLMDTTTITTNIVSSTYKLWDGPYMDENATVATMTMSATGTGAKTVTLSAASAINGGAGFLDSDIGRAFRIFSAVDGSKQWGWGIITDANTTLEADVYMVEDPSTTSAETRWALGSFSGTTGYPVAVSFFQQRLAFGGTRSQPQTIWMSVTAAFQEFDPTQVDDSVVDDNGIFITLATEDASHVRWIKSMRQMNIGTSGGVYQLSGDRNSNAVTPAFLSVDLASQWKVEDGAIPDNIGDTLFYVQQSGRVVRGVSPGAGGQAELQPNVTLLADHVTSSGVVELTYAAVPHSVLWGRRTDGLLIGCTVNPEERTLGWHRHPLAGTLSGSDWPEVRSLAVLPVDGHDQLYMAVRRTVNGAQLDTIECLQLPYDSNEMTQAEACYVDSGVLYEGVSTTAITGLSHLEGQSVIAWADGLPQGPFTVTSGAITLDTAATTVWVGLSYETISDMKTMPIKIPNDEGEKVRAVSTLLDVLDTVDLKIGQTTDAAQFKALQGMNPALTTAGTTDVRMVHNASADTRFQLTMRPVGAAPATVTGLTHQIEFAQP